MYYVRGSDQEELQPAASSETTDLTAMLCSTPLGCEGSSNLLFCPGTGHPWDGKRTGSWCPCLLVQLAPFVAPLFGTFSSNSTHQTYQKNNRYSHLAKNFPVTFNLTPASGSVVVK
jgi:hypothetical protein